MTRNTHGETTGAGGPGPIRVGIVGLGRSGWDIHAARLRGDERFAITAVCDPLTERLAEAREELGCATFTGFDDFVAQAECEVVVIASRSVDHAPQAAAILTSGRHTVVEKPLCMNAEEAVGLVACAEQAGRHIFVYYNYRFQPVVRHLWEVIRGGQLGDVFEIRIRVLDFRRRNDWQTLRRLGGGILSNTGSHFLDLAMQFLEAPVAAQFADLKLNASAGDAEDHAKLVLKGTNGRVVDLEVSNSCIFSDEPRWVILGRNGGLRSDGKESEIHWFDPKDVAPLAVDESAPAGRSYANEDRLPWRHETRPAMPAGEAGDYYDNLFAVLREGGEAEVKVEQILEVIRVTENAYRTNVLEPEGAR